MSPKRVLAKSFSALLIISCLIASIPASAAFSVRRSVIAGGIGVGAANFSLVGTVAQPAVGLATGANFSLSSGYWGVAGPGVVDVTEASRIPTSLELSRPQPNPTRGSMAITLGLPSSGRVSLLIYDLRGRKI